MDKNIVRNCVRYFLVVLVALGLFACGQEKEEPTTAKKEKAPGTRLSQASKPTWHRRELVSLGEDSRLRGNDNIL